MKKINLFVTSLILLSLMVSAASIAEAHSVSYKQIMKTGGMPPMTMRVWINNDMMRTEVNTFGTKVITIKRPDGTYNYMPAQRIITKVPNPPEDISQVSANPANYMSYLKQQRAKRITSETFNGYPCDVYEYTDNHSGVDVKVWVWKKKKFPVKMEMSGSPYGKTEIVFSDIEINKPIPGSFFELPQGVKLVDASSMGSSMGASMGMNALKDFFN